MEKNLILIQLSRVGKNRDYNICVRRFKCQCGRVYFGRGCSVGKDVTHTDCESIH